MRSTPAWAKKKDDNVRDRGEMSVTTDTSKWFPTLGGSQWFDVVSRVVWWDDTRNEHLGDKYKKKKVIIWTWSTGKGGEDGGERRKRWTRIWWQVMILWGSFCDHFVLLLPFHFLCYFSFLLLHEIDLTSCLTFVTHKPMLRVVSFHPLLDSPFQDISNYVCHLFDDKSITRVSVFGESSRIFQEFLKFFHTGLEKRG